MASQQVMLGVSLRARRNTTQVRLGVSLRARLDTTLVITITMHCTQIIITLCQSCSQCTHCSYLLVFEYPCVNKILVPRTLLIDIRLSDSYTRSLVILMSTLSGTRFNSSRRVEYYIATIEMRMTSENMAMR